VQGEQLAPAAPLSKARRYRASRRSPLAHASSRRASSRLRGQTSALSKRGRATIAAGLVGTIPRRTKALNACRSFWPAWAFPHVLIVEAGSAPRGGRDRPARLGDQLLGLLVHGDHRPPRRASA
jgi:hypothetical protein